MGLEMSTLQEQLEREVQKRGQKGKSLKEMYLEKSAEQEDSPDKSP